MDYFVTGLDVLAEVMLVSYSIKICADVWSCGVVGGPEGIGGPGKLIKALVRTMRLEGFHVTDRVIWRWNITGTPTPYQPPHTPSIS